MDRIPPGKAPLITLTTDFGWRDPYLAELKGAIASMAGRWPLPGPAPQVTDLVHDLPPGDVAAAGWFLDRVRSCWPAGTVHCAVVDPGVGTARPAVACLAGGSYFVGPGNGLLGFLTAAPDLQVARLAESPSWGHPATGRTSRTFHGRDLFAPAACLLALGVPLAEIGPAGSAADLGGPSEAGDVGERFTIRWIDRFGNAITDLPRESAAGRALVPGGRVRAGSAVIAGPVGTFAEAPGRNPFWYWGSAETLEIAVNGGSAAEMLGLRPGLDLVPVVP